MKIKQLTSYPIPNEIGLGNTNESYIRIENDIDVSDIFPPNVEVDVTDCITGKSYKLKAKEGIEFRINQLGQIYRSCKFYPGDEIKFTQIDDNGKKTVFFSIVKYNRTYISVGSKGTEIVNKDRIAGYLDITTNLYSIPVDGGILELEFAKSEKKRNDSPNNTDFYRSTVNKVPLNNGIYFITIDGGKAVLEREKKNKVEEFCILEGDDEKSIYTKGYLPLQTIYYGASGTGKSYKIKSEELQGVAEEYIFRTTFHPDYDYASFVGCYKPKKEDNKITYSFVPQVFTNAYIKAWNEMKNEEPKKVYLVIEEINRGNCAQIFGDLFQLLDRGDDGKSEYPVDADEDLKNYLRNAVDDNGISVLINKEGINGGKLCLPPNLNILATMNTSDQSLFPMDSAFKRRWEWEYVKIAKGTDKNGNELDWRIGVQTGTDWWAFIQKINAIIASMTSSADKQLGYFFCKADDKGVISYKTFVNKVCFYLWNDVFKDYGFEDKDLFRYEVTNDSKKEAKDLTFPDFFDDLQDDGICKSRVDDFIQKVLDWKSGKGDYGN